MKKFAFLLLSVLALLCTGCPRYETVRRVSQEQLNVQKAFRANLAEYFKHMEEFAANQVLLNQRKLHELRDEKLQNLEDNANDALPVDPTPTERDANRVQLGKDQAAWTTAYENKDKELDDLLVQLKNKHAEFLAAHDEIIATQEVLNDYIKLKKYDEVIVDGLMNKLKLNQDKVNNIFRDAASIADRLAKPAAVTTLAQGE